MQLRTDSGDYHLITNAVRQIKDVFGLTCEIGIREGGSSEFIMRALYDSGQHGRAHIAIDCYGHLEYIQSETARHRNDYTNEMKNRAMVGLYDVAQQTGVNLIVFNIEDTEFFRRFFDGVPVYNFEKLLINQYAFVHIDGPHSLEATLAETTFFKERCVPGSIITYDDVAGYYDHGPIRALLLDDGWTVYEETAIKASYIKK